MKIPFNLLIIISLFSCNPNKEMASNIEAKKTNIIYILADDLGYGDLSITGQTKFKTPNIDALAKSGMFFTQHYSGSTVCAPSRSTLLTGLHTGHTPIRGNKEILPEGQFPLADSILTLPEILKASGYKTGAFGKWGLGSPGSEGDPINQGFDKFYGFNCQRLGHHYYPYHLWHNQDSIPLPENSGTKKGVYAPSLIHEETLTFIEENKENPFFVYVASIIPHAELAAPENYIKKHKETIEETEPYIGLDDGPNLRLGTYQSQQFPHATFAAMVTLLDEQVGEIVQKVKDLGLEENTLIIFTSDNGPHFEGGADPDFFNSNAKFKGFKRDLYEGGIRVPMIASWKGKIEPESKTNHISAFWDVLPTVADVSNLGVPGTIDGISFLPTLLNDSKNQKQHDYLYWEFHELGGRQAIRKGDWKAVKYNVLKDPLKPLELYDLSSDPAEEINLVNEYPEKVKEFNKLFSSARTDSKVFLFDQGAYQGEI